MRLTLAVLVCALLSAGCASGNGGPNGDFRKEANKIRPGMTQAEVREALGAPDRKNGGTVDARPSPGPAAALVGAVPTGTRYQDWFYRRGDTHYHVLFAPNDMRNRLEVVTVRATPASAAVGGTDPSP